MSPDNRIVNSLWVGDRLSPVELLTLHTFTKHGHLFHLWVYNKLDNVLPDNVILKDANLILAEHEIFTKNEADPVMGKGKGGLTLFADKFRFNLLYQYGGWWVDMDMACVKPLSFSENYFFRSHPYFPTINNIIKVPPRSELMRCTSEEVNLMTNENTEDYLLPNRILNKYVVELSLERFIYDGLCNRDWWTDIEHFLFSDKEIPMDWYFLHWMNEEWRTQGLNKNSFYRDSRIHQLMEDNSISIKTIRPDKKYRIWHLKKNKWIKRFKPLLMKLPISKFIDINHSI